jgi:hypothetical protein
VTFPPFETVRTRSNALIELAEANENRQPPVRAFKHSKRLAPPVHLSGELTVGDKRQSGRSRV